MNLTNKNPYIPFLEKVQKPSRYIGDEHFIIKKNWSTNMTKVALCFPEVYEIGMGYLGLKILYDEINSQDNCLAERFFAPWPDMEKELRDRNLSLVSLENYKPLNLFDIVGFTLQYELTYTNILTILDLGSVSLWAKERKEGEPFVVGGGPGATHPEILSPFFDFFVIGDGEDLFVEIIQTINSLLQQGQPRNEILKELTLKRGIYVPLYKNDHQVKRFHTNSLNKFTSPITPPIPHITTIYDKYSLELARGCTEGCRFCQAGMIYRPVRERNPQDVIDKAILGAQMGGFKEISLTSLSTANYSAITPLLNKLLDEMEEKKLVLGLASLKAYGLHESVIDKLAKIENISLTFAPEVGTERLRRVINKNISEEDILKSAREIFQRGWKKIKLYFMIGLPTEKEEDVRAIIELSAKVKNEALMLGVKRPVITVSVSPFIPKPHTPFQWAKMISATEIMEKYDLLFKEAKKYKLTLKKHNVKATILEAILSRADNKIGQVIYNVYKKGGRFDAWSEFFNFDLWHDAFKEEGINPSELLNELSLESILPWSHIDIGLRNDFLKDEYFKAIKGELSLPCGRSAVQKTNPSNLTSFEKNNQDKKNGPICHSCGIACDISTKMEEEKRYLKDLLAFEENNQTYSGSKSKSILDFREKRGHNIGHKYRINWSKMPPLDLVSHLELQKVIARIFRRSNVEVLYSEGHKRRPLLSFGPAIPLGLCSLSEHLDFRTPQKFNLDQFIENLNKNSEKGMTFNHIFEIEKRTPSIQESVKKIEYFFPLNEPNTLHDINQIIDKILNENSDKKNNIISLTPFTGDNLINQLTKEKSKNGLKIILAVNKGVTMRIPEIKDLLENYGLKIGKPIKTASIVGQ